MQNKLSVLSCIILLCVPFLLQAQDCNCTSHYQWVKKTIEENDAGFQLVIDQKGTAAYQQHHKTYLEKVKQINNLDLCAETINQWFSFFRSGHISIKTINQNKPTPTAPQPTKEEIIKRYQNWKKLSVDLEEFKNYLQHKKTTDYEGIWSVGTNKIGIKKVKETYYGFIIEADGAYWTKNQIVLEMKPNTKAIVYQKDRTFKDYDASLIGKNYIMLGSIMLQRLVPKLDVDPEAVSYIKSKKARDPYLEKVNKNTLLLRIPSFSGLERSKIDNILATHRDKILSTPNLIIDLRDNGGGSDNSYQKLLPLLYTNPIKTAGVAYLSTPLNNQRMLDFVQRDDYGLSEADKKWAKASYDKLSQHLGEFVQLKETAFTTTKYDTIYPYPKNIGVIINENNGSTTEQFLLAAKQSKKVKLFGTTTAGVLDISNMYFVTSPCNELKLGYGLSKSNRIPHMTIDSKGIQPDYYIDEEIPKHQWIKFVSDILKE